MKSHILASTMYIDIVASNEVFISFVQASWVQFQSKVVHYFELIGRSLTFLNRGSVVPDSNSRRR